MAKLYDIEVIAKIGKKRDELEASSTLGELKEIKQIFDLTFPSGHFDKVFNSIDKIRTFLSPSEVVALVKDLDPKAYACVTELVICTNGVVSFFQSGSVYSHEVLGNKFKVYVVLNIRKMLEKYKPEECIRKIIESSPAVGTIMLKSSLELATYLVTGDAPSDSNPRPLFALPENPTKNDIVYALQHISNVVATMGAPLYDVGGFDAAFIRFDADIRFLVSTYRKFVGYGSPESIADVSFQMGRLQKPSEEMLAKIPTATLGDWTKFHDTVWYSIRNPK